VAGEGSAAGEAVLINAVAVVRARMWREQLDVHSAIAAARAAGTSEVDAMLSGARKRALAITVLPRLPDNDLINDRLRKVNGLPSLLMCNLDERVNA
jgi:hypothetical protein